MEIEMQGAVGWNATNIRWGQDIAIIIRLVAIAVVVSTVCSSLSQSLENRMHCCHGSSGRLGGAEVESQNRWAQPFKTPHKLSSWFQ